MRVKATLEWLKSELERNFEAEESGIIELTQDVLGKNADYLFFNSVKVAVNVMYWNTGIIHLAGVDIVADELFMDYWFVPDDYHTKEYPKESEENFVQKLNEMLTFLHNKNPNVKSQLPDNA